MKKVMENATHIEGILYEHAQTGAQLAFSN